MCFNFLDDYQQLYSHDPPSLHYFPATWKSFCGHIKTPKQGPFNVSNMWEIIRSAIQDAMEKGQTTVNFLLQKEDPK